MPPDVTRRTNSSGSGDRPSLLAYDQGRSASTRRSWSGWRLPEIVEAQADAPKPIRRVAGVAMTAGRLLFSEPSRVMPFHNQCPGRPRDRRLPSPRPSRHVDILDRLKESGSAVHARRAVVRRRTARAGRKQNDRRIAEGRPRRRTTARPVTDGERYNRCWTSGARSDQARRDPEDPTGATRTATKSRSRRRRARRLNPVYLCPTRAHAATSASYAVGRDARPDAKPARSSRRRSARTSARVCTSSSTSHRRTARARAWPTPRSKRRTRATSPASCAMWRSR